MPKKTVQRVIDAKRADGSSVIFGGGNGGGLVVVAHTHSFANLTGTATVAQVPWAASETLTLTAGAGLTGGGTLEADRTFAVGAGAGITVNADNVALASSTAGAGLTYTTGVLAVGQGTGITVNANDVALAAHDILSFHSYTGGAAYDVFGLSAASTLAKLTPSANVAGGVTALLRSNAGNLALDELSAAVRVGASLVNTLAGDMEIAPAGALKLDAGGNDILIESANRLRADNYASQTTGWRVTYTGEADFRYLYSDEMHVRKFVADLEQALAGRQVIAKSVSTLAQAFTAPAAGAATWLYVWSLPGAEDMDVFEAGDFIILYSFSRAGGSLTIQGCVGTVRKNTGEPIYADDADGRQYQQWHFTRASGTIGAGQAPGAMPEGTVIEKDAIVLDWGVSGNGAWEVNAIDGAYGVNSPYAQVVTWTTNPNTGRVVRTRVGNLKGITGTTGEFGLFAGAGTATSDAHVIVSSAQAKFNMVPITMYNGATKTGAWLADGNFRLSKDDVDTAANRDFYVDTTNGVVRIGRTGTNKPNVYWDGSSLSIRNDTTDVITLNSSGNASIAGLLRVGASGGVQVGTGTKDSNLAGWHIGSTEIVGQLDGADQVVLDTSGQITWAAGNGVLNAAGAAIDVTGTSSYMAARAYSFKEGSTALGGVSGYIDGTTRALALMTEPLSTDCRVDVNAATGSSYSAGVRIGAASVTGLDSRSATLSLYAKASTAASTATLDAATITLEHPFYGLDSSLTAVTVNGSISTPDDDIQYLFGKAVVGKVTTSAAADAAYFANRDINTHAGAALIQNASGDTYLQAASGRTGYIRENGTSNLIATWTANGFESEKFLRIAEIAAGPSGFIGADTEAVIYVRGNKFVVANKTSSTVKYRYMDLSSTNANWTYTTTEPT